MLVIAVFYEKYLCAPYAEDTERILVRFVCCMHWRWCLMAWHGQFTGHVDDAAIILEVVADKGL